ncbi:MAG: 5-formyltetrahydrofolate cyclo-ligase [Methyloligellaceae bacterium]
MPDSGNTVSLEKNRLRKQLKPQREKITDEEYQSSAALLASADLTKLGINQNSVIAGYYPIRRECNCLQLLENLHNQNIVTALPVIRGDELSLHFREWAPADLLISGQLNIPEPDSKARNVTPDILLIPLLAFDKNGYRLGYGKGHYDRTLAELRKNASVTAVGIAYDAQEIPQIPFDQYDQRLDWILTPSGLKKLGE